MLFLCGQGSLEILDEFERQFATVKHDVQRKERNNPWKTCRLVYVSAKGLAKYAVVSSRNKMR